MYNICIMYNIYIYIYIYICILSRTLVISTFSTWAVSNVLNEF